MIPQPRRAGARLFSSSILKSMLGVTSDSQLPATLAPAHRVLQRWAVSVGTGLADPDAEGDVLASRPTPLDDETAILVDQIILKSAPRTRKFVQRWYKSTASTTQIAEQMGLTEREALKCWKLCLYFLDERFRDSGNATLLAILKISRE